MRIVAGTFRGRPLVAPKGQSTRPTADRTRQALFDVLAHAPWAPPLAGARVLDLFAGSGALGFEALSRGAALVRFVESSEAARAAILANADALGVADQVSIDRRDALALGPAAPGEPGFDLAFLDPPYGRGLGEPALERLAAGGWLAPAALAVLERGADDPAPAPAGFRELDARTWGAARVSFLAPGA
ncbi:MAG TPA: 16S rRNA (guanine(966)-N(2))-methyltransferase RsmD [Caulobacteraceae bacterium]|jgi:16S rRNA (guanine966-N2)-methyltransferase